MIFILSLILVFTFGVLSVFHFYWFFGGKWALDKVIPSRNDNLKNLQIPKIATLMVALILIAFAVLYLNKTNLLELNVPIWIRKFGYWIIPIMFIIRAIGEFKYVGLFKKIKTTEFANADTKIFTPLCLTIGFFGILTNLL